ncbi:MAG TPA: cyclopropane-fatty-acyl-phospholipid synthase family protein [Solirubrobacteraceae bacterium]|jgi:cyclopropane-fatty-acyl-phospholipid synthase|nr:cyclopropane-fatty-acyl-phospholipid synthase family protein [Solirubrobacteraceae bacterium]
MGLGSTTAPLRSALGTAVPERPFAVRFWDGTVLPATIPGGAPEFRVHSPRALGHALLAPGQLGLSRAYVSGELEVDDLDALLALLRDWKPPPLDGAAKRALVLGAVRAAGIMRPPRPPAVELRPRGQRHSVERDARAVRHHYDVSNDFFSLFLDESMTYSCAIFEDPARDDESLESAQVRKRETICRKLALAPGERVLDVGCGWGAFPIHAATKYGVHVVGITLSEPQAALARQRAAAAGVADRVEIRVMDYRDLRGERFDAIASIGMVEHVGAVQLDEYAATLARLLEPGGRLLNHGIARLRHGEAEAGPFSERYVFPDAAPMHLSRVLLALERAGFVCEHVEGYGAHYARTLAHWAQRLDEHAAEGARLAGAQRMRVWRLYLRGARGGFETGFTSIYQVRCRRA